MHDRLRRQDQHQERGRGQRAHGQRRPVEHDADQHDRDHEIRALRRHFGARQHQIKRRRDQRAERRPFLDRPSVGKARDQRQQGADDEEHDAGDDRHVIAGDRQHVADAGNEHGVVEILRDHVAPAVEQHRRDRAGVARQHGADMRVDGVAQRCTTASARCMQTGRGRRRNHIDRAAHEAGGADLLEIKIAGEIVTSPAPAAAAADRACALTSTKEPAGGAMPALDREPHPLRLVVDAVAVDARRRAARSGRYAGFLRAVRRSRRSSRPRPQSAAPDARSWRFSPWRRQSPRRRRKQKAPTTKAAKCRRSSTALHSTSRGKRRRRPPRRLALRREVDDDAETVGDREPGQQAIRRPSLGRPIARNCVGRAKFGVAAVRQPHAGRVPTGQGQRPATYQPAHQRACGSLRCRHVPLRAPCALTHQRLMLARRAPDGEGACANATSLPSRACGGGSRVGSSRRRTPWPRCRASRPCG